MFQIKLLVQITKQVDWLKSNFFTEDRMVRKTYVNEKIMFTNKVNQRIVWGGKGEYGVPF